MLSYSVAMSSYQLPQYISSSSDLTRVVKLGETAESATLEFKADLPISSTPKDRRELLAEEVALDICQFLNSLGGVLLIGVKESTDSLGEKKVASGYTKGLKVNEILEFINSRVVTWIYPSDIHLHVATLNSASGEQVVAVNIHPLATGLACVCMKSEPYTAKYPYRTHFGKKYFPPSEVEKRMSNGNRGIFLRLSELAQHTRDVTLLPGIIKEQMERQDTWDARGANPILKEISEDSYMLSVNGLEINIPFSMTKNVWLTERNTVGIQIDMRLVISGNRREIRFDS